MSYRFTFIVADGDTEPADDIEVVISAPTITSAHKKLKRVIADVIEIDNPICNQSPTRIEEI